MITRKLIEEYLSDGTLDSIPSDTYLEKSKQIDEEIQDIFGDCYPKYMDLQRPNQPVNQIKYRKEYFEGMGNPLGGVRAKINNQGDKIFSSDDFKISYSINSKTKNGLKKYCENYWNGKSLIKSFRSSIIDKVNFNPNGLIAILPNPSSEGINPYFSYVKSEKVIYYKANTLAIWEGELKCDVRIVSGESEHILKESGSVYYFFDSTHYVICKHAAEVNGSIEWEINWYDKGNSFVRHGCDFMPVMKLGRILKETSDDGSEVRSSDIFEVKNYLKEANLSYLDMVVELNHHSASQEYAVASVKCTECYDGKAKGDKQKGNATCSKCNGSTWIPALNGSGLDRAILPPTIPNESPNGADILMNPKDMFGFIKRPKTGLKAFKEDYNDNLKKALEPFGLDHLIESPYNQSGEAKDRDMQEAHAFIRSFAEHMRTLVDFVLRSVVCEKYKNEGRDVIENEFAQVIVPGNVNLHGSSSLIKRISDGAQYNIPSIVIQKYTKELIALESGSESMEMKMYELKLKFDPMANETYNNKVIARSWLSDIDYILTMNISRILSQVIIENSNFLLLGYQEQRDIIYRKAQGLLNGAKKNLEADIVIKPSINIVNEDQTK